MTWWKRIIEYGVIRGLGRYRCRFGAKISPLPRHVIAAESFGVGDVVCALPAVRALKQQFSDAELTFLTSRAAGQFCNDLPFIDQLEICPRSWSEASAFLSRWKSRRAETLTVLLNDGWWQNVAIHRLGSRWSCGYLYRPRWDNRYHPERLVCASWQPELAFAVASATHLVKRSWHAAAPALEMISADSPIPPVPELIADVNAEIAALRDHGVDLDLPFVVLHPGTGRAVKRWPAEYWRELIWQLAPMCPVVLTGGAAETEFGATLLPSRNELHVRSLCGKLSLKEEAVLMKYACCTVAPDCGPLHLASAVGGKTIALMGPTAPATSAPYWGSPIVLRCPEATVVEKMGEMSLADSADSMRAITPEQVLLAVREVVEEPLDELYP